MTGCKINVSQPQQPDVQRQIGLVGSRAAIEEAKRAIWEKVDTVVCDHFHLDFKNLADCISNNVTQPLVEVAAMAIVMTVATVTNTHNHSSSSTDNHPWLAPNKACSKCLPCPGCLPCLAWLNQVLQLLQVVIQVLIHMLLMVATRITWHCGMLLLLPSKAVAKANRLCLSEAGLDLRICDPLG